MKKDNVNHPKHYAEGSLECIQVMGVLFGEEVTAYFCLCNAFKYMWRYRNKNGLEDIQKAEWYLNYAGVYADSKKSATVTVLHRRLYKLYEKVIFAYEFEDK